MDASGLSTSGTHTIWASPLGSEVRGGPGNVNFAGGIGNDSFAFGTGMSRAMGSGGNDGFTLVKGGIAAGDQVIDFHLNLADGGEHDTLRLLGFSAAAHLDLLASVGTAHSYQVVDGDYVSPSIVIQVANGSVPLGGLDYQFG